jgi:hypothetical protein
MTARRPGSWRAARSNACEMQHVSAAAAIPQPKDWGAVFEEFLKKNNMF